ncbi:MAG: ATP-dependent RecD-like DNA helicase [Tepidibacillus sp.]
MVEYTGKIKAVLYRNQDFFIGMLDTDNETIKILGLIFGVEKGEKITVFGEWENNKQHGNQFKVERWERPLPKTNEQITAFLSSSLVKGIGEKRARDLVKLYGVETLNIIMNDGEEAVLKVKGIGKKKAKIIVESVRSTLEFQNIMMELSVYGITTNMILRAYKEYGSNTAEIIKKNPYLLTKLKLIGFTKADKIAKKIGISPISGFRIESAIDYVLNDKCYSNGHCYIPEKELLDETLLVLNHNTNEKLIFKDLELGLMNLNANNQVIIEENRVYPRHLYKYEDKVVEKFTKFLNVSIYQNAPQELIEKEIKRYEKNEGITLADGQKNAIRELFTENLMILTGGPGTGKTTVIKAIIEIYKRLFPENSIGLAAPTGRASRKMKELTGLEAFTIHSLIGYRQGDEPEYNEQNPLPYNFVIVDEWSMGDIQIAYYLLQSIAKNTKLLFVGDPDQLPSVNPGHVLKDMLDAGVPAVQLNEVFRQAQDSQIIMNAHRINKGKNIVIDPRKDDFKFIEKETPEQIAKTINDNVLEFINKGYFPSDIMVLSPMKKGIIGTIELNKMLQKTLNPPTKYKNELKYGETIFREGDKILRVGKNDKNIGVFNGDLGTIIRIDYLKDEDGNITEEKGMYCDFHGRELLFQQHDLKWFELGYATTIHKSQGGQAKVVIIPLHTTHFLMLTRNLLYTGDTRAESYIRLIGTRKALMMAIKNNKNIQRNTNLAEKLKRNLIGYEIDNLINNIAI